MQSLLRVPWKPFKSEISVANTLRACSWRATPYQGLELRLCTCSNQETSREKGVR
jgi:hypothetical protein